MGSNGDISVLYNMGGASINQSKEIEKPGKLLVVISTGGFNNTGSDITATTKISINNNLVKTLTIKHSAGGSTENPIYTIIDVDEKDTVAIVCSFSKAFPANTFYIFAFLIS